MSGVPNPPLLAPAEANKLLEEVIYERVLGFIDLDGLYEFERDLWCAFDECGFDEEKVPEIVKDMVDRALRRVCDDPRRYTRFQPALSFDDCELCEAETKAAKRKAS